MGQITVWNEAAADVVNVGNITEPPYDVRFHVLYWQAEIGDVEVDKGKTATINSPSLSATLQAIALTENPPPSISYSIEYVTSAQNMCVMQESNGTLKLYYNGGTTDNSLTLTNQCTFPVQFVLTIDGPTQSWQVAPGQSLPIGVGNVFMAYARVHGYAGEPVGSNGYDTPMVGFTNPNSWLTVEANSSKGDKYHIMVTDSEPSSNY